MILNILAVVVGIAAVIGIHEACHMLVSKLFGVKVLKFSLGFGPVIFSKQIGETQYQLAALPLGGYVAMEGDDPESNVERGFFNLPWWKRALIALAGPVANLILGFLLIFSLLVLFKGWPIIEGLGRAWTIFSFVIVTTLKWVFGMLPATKDIPSGTAALSGPIMVTKILLSSAKEGASQFLFVLSLISLSLGLFNLFPLPMLDGGHIALYFAEFIRGRRFSSKVYLVWNYIGFVLLISLLLFTCFTDIRSLLQ
jgi:membrane-associated protease RseP (regulator of RpoE activity)